MSIQSRNAVILAAILLVVVLTSIPYGVTQENPPNPTDLSGVNVAVYTDEDALACSTLALRNMFQWMNATADFIDAEEIRNGSLDSYDLIAFPGGSALAYSYSLEPEGLDMVRDFVRTGGSYIGICGGALFGTNAVLGLFNGSYSSSVNGTGMFLTEMNVNRGSTGPDLSNEPESYQTMYWGSAYFYSDDMSDVIPICTYPSNDRPGMIALTYGEGTVFLSSPHPEYEEGDGRDGISLYDQFDDPDSEWGLLLKVSKWLVDASMPSNGQDGIQFSTYLVLGTIGILGLIVTVYIVRSRFS
ncbi:MAG: BPL-N domain-containing protein [Candidatus Thorarchaeota archaeon]|jgi:glutamine amidotransferase-like uncharacterized protein